MLLRIIKNRIRLFKLNLVYKWSAQFGLSPIRMKQIGKTWYILNNDGSMHVIGRKPKDN